jgi:hypothetical protein
MIEDVISGGDDCDDPPPQLATRPVLIGTPSISVHLEGRTTVSGLLAGSCPPELVSLLRARLFSTPGQSYLRSLKNGLHNPHCCGALITQGQAPLVPGRDDLCASARPHLIFGKADISSPEHSFGGGSGEGRYDTKRT